GRCRSRRSGIRILSRCPGSNQVHPWCGDLNATSRGSLPEPASRRMISATRRDPSDVYRPIGVGARDRPGRAAHGRKERHVTSRRDFMKTGLQALLLGLMRRPGLTAPLTSGLFAQDVLSAVPPALWGSRPFLEVPRSPESILVNGLPFAAGFCGDPWSYSEIPFHQGETTSPRGMPPSPSESGGIPTLCGRPPGPPARAPPRPPAPG